jgi:hypothetical protein
MADNIANLIPKLLDLPVEYANAPLVVFDTGSDQLNVVTGFTVEAVENDYEATALELPIGSKIVMVRV